MPDPQPPSTTAGASVVGGHPSEHDLESCLRGTGSAATRDAVRHHLDRCRPCWTRWNAYRWRVASIHPLYAELARFLGGDFQPGRDSSHELAAEWDRVDPQTEDEVVTFFRASVSYLYNLVIWEASGHRPDYVTESLPHLAANGIRSILDFGCGIGSDTIAFHSRGYEVVGCDYESPSTRFLHWRSGGDLVVVEPHRLDVRHGADAVWVIDTLDHLPDIGGALGRILPRARMVITENLHVGRAHGRQRFHIRRSVEDVQRILAGYGHHLDHVGRSIMVWRQPTGRGPVTGMGNCGRADGVSIPAAQ